MPQQYTVRDPQTRQVVTFQWNDSLPPTDADMDQIFAEANGDRPADFRTEVRASEGLADAPPPQTVGRFLGQAAKAVLPSTTLSDYWEGPAYALRHPIESAKLLGGAVVGAQNAMVGKALSKAQAAAGGDMLALPEAVAYGAAAALPVIGPAAAAAGEQIASGDIVGGLGTSAGLLAPTVVPAAVRASQPLRASIRERLRAKGPGLAEGDAVRFGLEQDIPLDAATVTGNPAIRGTQYLADRSLLGAGVARKAGQRQAEALSRVGEGLANRARPGGSVTPEQAGQGVREAVKGKVREFHGEANRAYSTLRDIESGGVLDEVPVDLPKPVKARMREQLGRVPTGDEIRELRRIAEELDAVPFQRGKLTRDTGPGFDSGETTYSARAAGAPVYDEILQEAPGTSNMTRADVQASIQQALKTGRMTHAAQGALKVAQNRLGPGGGRWTGTSSPILPPGAGTSQQLMPLSVDIGAAKKALGPFHAELLREKELVGVLQGNKARALKALDDLMMAPDHAPLSTVDAGLSSIKALARGADMPELRTQGQGVAARAVRSLDEQVTLAAQRAGEPASQALKAGRAATTQKYAAKDVLKQISVEPVKAFGQSVWAKDAGIERLRAVAKLAPDEMPKVGRAYLEDLLTTANAEPGVFSKPGTLWSKWQNLGPETKGILFPDRGLVRDLDHFFLLAKKIGENPNPSGSAIVGWQGAQGAGLVVNPAVGVPLVVSGYVLSKLLHAPTTVRLLTRGLQTSRTGRAGSALSAELVRAVKAVEGGAVAGGRIRTGVEGAHVATGPRDEQVPERQNARDGTYR